MGSFIGIDLGTTFSAIAKVDSLGRPEIIPNEDGERLTPSCVEVDAESGKIYVGERARRTMSSGVGDDIAAGRFKRAMGTEKTYVLAGRKFTPVELSSFVLKKVLKDAAHETGEISESIVTVPANFSHEAREATITAAKQAGLNLRYIINEPTAAALSYSFKEGLDLNGIYAVYDMGGGTFDISIIRINGYDVEVITSNGIAELGGIDFDNDLFEVIARKYQALTEKKLEIGDYPLHDVEDDKKPLSKRDPVRTRSIHGEFIEITRQEFEAAISKRIAQAEMLCESTLDNKKLSPSDIKGVLCAGGSTRIPMVRESIKRVFQQEPIFKANVDEVVALGAALYAAYKNDSNELAGTPIEKINVTERTSRCYGTVIVQPDGDGNARKVNRVLIKRDTKIPHTIEESFYTTHAGQTRVHCRVTESPKDEEDLQFVHIKGKSTILKLPPDRPTEQEIRVRFSYDENQMMECIFTDVASGTTAKLAYDETQGATTNTDADANADTDADVEKFTVE